MLATPLLPHPSLMVAQAFKHRTEGEALRGRLEFYGNYPRQRADLVSTLYTRLDTPALIVFSGDVHHGSVIDGLYVHGASRWAIDHKGGDWAMRIAQVTSSPIKNIKHELVKQLGVSSQGNIGESLIRSTRTSTRPPRRARSSPCGRTRRI